LTAFDRDYAEPTSTQDIKFIWVHPMPDSSPLSPEPQAELISRIDADLAGWHVDRLNQDPLTGAKEAVEILARAEAIGYRNGRAHAHLVIGGAYAFMSDHQTAEYHLGAAEALFVEGGDELGRAHTILRRNIILHHREQYDDAISWLITALEIVRRLGDERLESWILSDQGVNYRIAGRIEEAIECFRTAIAISDKRDDDYSLATFRLNLAQLLIDQHDYEIAATWLRESLATAYRYEDVSLAHYCEHGLAICEARLENYETALTLLTSSAGHAVAFSYPLGLGEVSFEEGLIRMTLDDRDGAITAFRRAAEAYERIGDMTMPVRAILARWWVESLSGAYCRETHVGLLALEPDLESASDPNAYSAYDALSASFEQAGDTSAALIYARKSMIRKERYWKETARAQSHLAAKKHQLETAERAAERERKQSEELSAVLRQVVVLNRQNEVLVEHLKLQSAILEQQATEDPLTKSWNRRYFDEQLERELTRSAQFGRIVSVGLADIDNFKSINDRYSHQIGDTVLKTVASLFRCGIRETDIVARYGGEEFAFIFPEAERETAETVAERIRRKVEHYPWYEIAPGLAVTLSFGVISGEGETAQRLISAADELLYLAKRNGKNQVRSRAIGEPLEPAETLFTPKAGSRKAVSR
jgi:diguanylate cyclase (GGDEF)-like protein